MNTTGWLQVLDSAGFKVFHILTSIVWQSILLLIGAGILDYLLRKRKPSIRHILWTLAVLVVPLIPLLSSGIAKIGTPQKELAVIPAYETHRVEITDIPAPQEFPHETIKKPQLSEIETARPLPEIPVSAPPVAYTQNKVQQLPNFKDYPWALALTLYAAGVLCFLAWICIGRLRIRSWILDGFPVMNQTVIEIFQKAAHHIGLKRDFLIIENGNVPAPMTCRIIRPVIILPAGFSDTMSEQDLKTVALHELSHVKRNDVIVFAFLSFIKAVFFLHPAVWFAVRRISYLAELACDAEVVQNTYDSVIYADMLIRIADHLPKHALTTELAAGILFSKSSFFRRIEAILLSRKNQFRKLSRLALTGTVITAVMVLVIALVLPLGYARERGNTVTVSGTVLYKGAPVKDAGIYFSDGRSHLVEKVADTDKNGHFSFETEQTKIFEDHWSPSAIIGFGKSYAPGFVNVTKPTETTDLTIELNDPTAIAGTAKDVSGNPVGKATISVTSYMRYKENKAEIARFDKNDIPLFRTLTDKDGKFTLSNVPAGHMALIIVTGNGYAKELQVLQQTNVENVAITLKPESRIEGKITYGTNGQPAANVKIMAKRTGMPRLDTEVFTDKKGQYKFSGLQSDNYNLYAIPSGDSPEWAVEKKENIVVKEGETIHNTDFILTKGGIVSGKVTDADTGEPIPNHFVSLHDKTLDDYHDPVVYTFTGENGEFRFRTAMKAVRLMTSKPDGYLQPDWWKQGHAVDDFRIKVDTDIIPGETATVDKFTFNKSAVIHGLVHTKDGQPVAGATITHGESFARKQVTSGEDGTFVISGYKTGDTIPLKAMHDELKLRGKIDLTVKPDSVKLQGNNEITSAPDINAYIELEKFEIMSITGKVLDFDKNPVANANVMLEWDGGTKETIPTDKNGRYRFDGLIIGDEYCILSETDGYYYDNLISDKLFIAGESMQQHPDILLHKTDRWIEGIVTDQNGNPIAGASISCNGRSRTTTNSEGYFHVDNLFGVAAKEIMIVQKDYGNFDFMHLPTNQRHHFTLVKGKYTFSGKVVDTKGNPIQSARIRIEPTWHRTGQYISSFETGPDGKFSYTNMIEKFVDLTVYIPSQGFKKFTQIKTQENVELVFDKADEPEKDTWEFNDKGVVILDGKPAPELKLKNWINGTPVTIQSCKDNVVLLDFMACEKPRNGAGDYTYNKTRFINALYNEYKDKGLIVIGIHEYTPDIEAIKNVIRENGLSYGIALDTGTNNPGYRGSTFETFGISDYIKNVIIDRHGIVHTNFQNTEMEIRKLLNEGS